MKSISYDRKIMEIKKQFLPALLDRLIDDEPRVQQERYDKTFYDAKTMRAIVLRDLMGVLNSSNIENQLHAKKHALVAESVLNYGIAALPGSYENQNNWSLIEKNVREGILRFEPRIIPESLVVSPRLNKDRASLHGVILFEIRGLIDWKPYPLELAFSGGYDSETEKIDIKPV